MTRHHKSATTASFSVSATVEASAIIHPHNNASMEYFAQFNKVFVAVTTLRIKCASTIHFVGTHLEYVTDSVFWIPNCASTMPLHVPLRIIPRTIGTGTMHLQPNRVTEPTTIRRHRH
ncbi:unnamed protein product, partial [Adineta ricciae]